MCTDNEYMYGRPRNQNKINISKIKLRVRIWGPLAHFAQRYLTDRTAHSTKNRNYRHWKLSLIFAARPRRCASALFAVVMCLSDVRHKPALPK